MHHVWNHHHPLCHAVKEASINFIISFLVSFDVDINTLHSSGAVIKKFVFMDMHTESLYAELTGTLAKPSRDTANNAKRWLKIHPPTNPSPLQPTAAWHFALKCKAPHSFVSVWKGISTRTNDSTQQIKGIFFLLLNLHGASCCCFNLLIAVWAQINDTSEAPPDTREVQWLVFKHSCVSETIFSV